LKSGSLYPLLMRLAEQGVLTAAWEQNPPVGRPARHLYRLTPHGIALADQLRPAPTSARFVARRGTRATT
jgi:PadR family transcriptional regulator, regulatory protein PadR